MLIVEDGSGVENANSYCDETDANAYFELRGNTAWTGISSSPDQGKPAALIRATAAIDATYRSRFGGTKTGGRAQSLQWPRSGAYDAEGELIASDEIPQEVIDATCEAALRELAEPGSMMPDIAAGGVEKRIKAGSVEIERFGNAPAAATFSIIDGILSGLIGSATASFIGTAVRG